MDHKLLKTSSVFEYRLATDFLEAVYERRKRKEPGFSYEKWAIDMGFKSRSFLKMLVSGKRKITRRFADHLCTSMNFNDSERAYFHLIAAHEQADGSEKEIYLNRIFEQAGRHKKVATVESEQFVSMPQLPRLFALLGFVDVKGNVENLSRIMQMREAEVLDLLQKLEDLDLVVRSDEMWKPKSDSFRVPNQFGSDFLKLYHSYTFQEADKAQSLDHNLRRFRSLMLALSEKEFTALLDQMESFVSQTIGRYDFKNLAGRRLYKVNFNLYPVSEKQV